jgi:DNA-binding MarR family transcriptional regulator
MAGTAHVSAALSIGVLYRFPMQVPRAGLPGREETSEFFELAAAFHPRLVRLYTMLRRDTLDLGLSRTALSVLAQLRERAPQRITELAAAEHVKQPTMTTLIGRLEQRGWVIRGAHPRDRRVVLVSLSTDGERALDRLTRERVLALAGRLGGLTAEERAALAHALPALDRLIDIEQEER